MRSTSTEGVSAAIAVNVRLAALLVVLLAPAAARAQTRVRALTLLGAGASDNARSGVADETQVQHSTAAFGRTQIALDLVRWAATSTQELHYGLAATAYATSSNGQTLTQDLSWQSQLVWPRATMSLGATAAYGVINDVAPVSEPRSVTVAAPDGTAPRDLPPGPDLPTSFAPFSPDDQVGPDGLLSFVGGAVGEAMSIEIGPRVYGYQGLDAQAFAPIVGTHADPPIMAMSPSLGIERAFARASLRLESDGSLESAPARLVDNVMLPAQIGQIGRAALGAGYQLGPGWRLDGSAGTFAARGDLHDPFVIGPAWRAALRGRGLHFRGGAVYDHSALASVVLGGVFAADRVTLSSTGAFGQDERIHFVGSARWQSLRALDSPIPEHAVTRWQAQVGLHVRPWPRRMVDVALSYRLTHQNGGMLGLRRMRTFERNMLLLTLTAGVPMAGIPD